MDPKLAVKRTRPILVREYAERVRRLKAYGFQPTYRLRLGAANTPAAKGAVTRAWKKHQYFLTLKPETQPVHFVRFKTKAERKAVSAQLSKEAITPGGFFVQVPKGVKPSAYKVSLNSSGEIVESTRGRQHDIIFRPDYVALAGDGKNFLKAELKARAKAEGRGIRGVRIMVGGFEGKSLKSPKEIGRYIASLKRRVIGSGRGQLSAAEFEDKFQLKILFRAKRKK